MEKDFKNGYIKKEDKHRTQVPSTQKYLKIYAGLIQRLLTGISSCRSGRGLFDMHVTEVMFIIFKGPQSDGMSFKKQ